ncbi:NAD(+)/NADH kinase [Luteolibacter pohnpeiensis]|uniref:NAD(+)/NADH kinase n=1 Tax=Luteolibacter pohnpeiensis TaxID=454153 RepID=UPI001904FE9E|nr:NAD(+)/NADH kinase [Luteolibacter pohnpeiensis]
MKVGIIVNPRKTGAVRTMRALRTVLQAKGISCVLEEYTAELAGEGGGIPATEFSKHVAIAAVLGGDGTMLNAVLRLGKFEKPVAGINIGTLGFLTTSTDDDLESFAEALETGSYTISKRTLLEATVYRAGKATETFFALNEITLARGETGRLVSLRATLNGDLLNHYRADGLIVATPTGSTAYSLSAGGPLIEPSAAVFVVTPICPHSLSQRSLIVADDAVIGLSPENPDDGPMLFTADGRDNSRIEPGDSVEVRKADRNFLLLRYGGMSFYEALRQKLHWQGL